MSKSSVSIDYERLFRLRLVVARYGEMDIAQWWNTQGVLSRRGSLVYKRGLPRTHYFAQARVVFAVARARCLELFNPPDSMTLWNLPAEIEDQFEDHWQGWIDERDKWSGLFEALASYEEGELLDFLLQSKLIAPDVIQEVKKLKRSSENRAVPIPGAHIPNDDVLTLLAAGFTRGESAGLAIPFAKLEGRYE